MVRSDAGARAWAHLGVDGGHVRGVLLLDLRHHGGAVGLDQVLDLGQGALWSAREEKKDATSTSRGKTTGALLTVGRRRGGDRGTSARAALTKRGARAVLRDTPDRALPRETRALIAIAWRVESRHATDLEGVRFLGGGVVIARLGEHLGAGDELHGVRGGGLDEREALKIGGVGDGGHGDVRAVGGDARSACAGGDGGGNAYEENEAASKRRSENKQACETLPDRSVLPRGGDGFSKLTAAKKLRKERLDERKSGQSRMRVSAVLQAARLVRNHSSFAPGLEPVLKALAARMPSTDTITPGRLAKTGGRSEHFELRFGAAGPSLHGFKLLARKGKSSQEVFVNTKLGREEMEAHVAGAIEKVHG